METDTSDIQRSNEVARLLEVIQHPKDRLNIVGISGPGGIGKSFLLHHALDKLEGTDSSYLRLVVDGSNRQSIGDFFSLIGAQLLPRSLPSPADAQKDYFPQVRKISAMHRQLVEEVGRELGKKGAPQDVKEAAVALLRAGHLLNKTVPKSRKYLDVSALNLTDDAVREHLDDAWRLVESASALSDSTPLPGPIADAIGLTQRNRVRRDLYNVVADAMLSDIAAALVGYLKKDRFSKVAHTPIGGLNQLMLIIDDFEAIAPVLEDFFISSLIPRLSAAPFTTVMIVLCRDDLKAMHPGWEQHSKRFVREQIRLRAFDREAAFATLARGTVTKERWEDLYTATQGFPFLLNEFVEESGAESALFLRKFFDRQTRWMSREQVDWFTKTCYLTEVNEDTLLRFFSRDVIVQVQSWFERESSIRDSGSATFRVRPLIREWVLRYLEAHAPSRHREMTARGRGEVVTTT